MRRSSVRRMLGSSSGWRRRSSSSTAIARMPGAAFRIGTTSASQYVAERIGPSPAARRLLLRGQARIGLDPVAGRGREAGLGGGRRRRVVGLSETHVQPHLVVGDVEAGQTSDPSIVETNQKLDPVLLDRQTGLENAPPGLGCRRSGYALPPSAHPRRILILIDAALSP